MEYDAIPINKNLKSEDTYTSLPDLYIRKYVLCEKLAQSKKHYVPKVNIHDQTNQEIRRPLQKWGEVLRDIQNKSFDLQQRKKWRISAAFTLAKEAQKNCNQKIKDKEEVHHFSIFISSILAKQVQKAFVMMDENKSLFKYINDFNNIQEYEKDYDYFANRNQESYQKVKEYLTNNKEYQQQFEHLFPELATYSETNQIDSQPQPLKKNQLNLNKMQLDFDYDPRKKYDNLQEILQLFYLKDVPLKEQFEKSQFIENFPSSFEQVERICNHTFTAEPCLDQEYEDLLYNAGCIPEQVLRDGERMMKRMKLFANFQQDTPLPNEMETRDFFRYKYNYIERECYFGQLNGKWIPKDETRFEMHPQQLQNSTEILKYYFIQYLQKYNNDYNQISMALSANPCTSNLFTYSPLFCSELYAYYVFRKDIKSNSKFLVPHQYYDQSENKQYTIQQEALGNQQKSYEEMLNQQYINKKVNLYKVSNQNTYKTSTFNAVKLDEICSKFRPTHTIVKPSSFQPDYSMVEKLSFSNLKDIVKQSYGVHSYLEKKSKAIHDITRQDSAMFDNMKRELRKQYRPAQPRYPQQQPAHPPNHGPQHAKLIIPPQQIPQQLQINHSAPPQQISAPPPAQPQPQPQPQHQPQPQTATSQQQQQPQPQQQSGKKTKSHAKAETVAPPATANKKRNPKKEEQSAQQQEQAPAPPARGGRRTKKGKGKQEEDKGDE